MLIAGGSLIWYSLCLIVSRRLGQGPLAHDLARHKPPTEEVTLAFPLV
jgi:hypothetical protein